LAIPIIIAIVVIALFLWSTLSPKSMYWTLSAWQHKDPEANEPSDSAYAMTRISSFVGLGLFLICVAALWSIAHQDQVKKDSEAKKLALCKEILPEFKSLFSKETGIDADDFYEFAERIELRGEIDEEDIYYPYGLYTYTLTYEIYDKSGELIASANVTDLWHDKEQSGQSGSEPQSGSRPQSGLSLNPASPPPESHRYHTPTCGYAPW